VWGPPIRKVTKLVLFSLIWIVTTGCEGVRENSIYPASEGRKLKFVSASAGKLDLEKYTFGHIAEIESCWVGGPHGPGTAHQWFQKWTLNHTGRMEFSTSPSKKKIYSGPGKKKSPPLWENLVIPQGCEILIRSKNAVAQNKNINGSFGLKK